MSEQEINSTKAEIGDVPIVEYRTNQVVRLAECAFFGLCVYAGVKYKKELPAPLRYTLILGGAVLGVFAARSFYLNHRQDGKLIREAIKNRKADEASIRAEKLKEKIRNGTSTDEKLNPAQDKFLKNQRYEFLKRKFKEKGMLEAKEAVELARLQHLFDPELMTEEAKEAQVMEENKITVEEPKTETEKPSGENKNEPPAEKIINHLFDNAQLRANQAMAQSVPQE